MPVIDKIFRMHLHNHITSCMAFNSFIAGIECIYIDNFYVIFVCFYCFDVFIMFRYDCRATSCYDVTFSGYGLSNVCVVSFILAIPLPFLRSVLFCFGLFFIVFCLYCIYCMSLIMFILLSLLHGARTSAKIPLSSSSNTFSW